MKNKLNVLGIMSGTSLDGADFVKIKISKKNLKCEYVGMQSFRFPGDLKKKLLACAQNEKTVYSLAAINHELGKFYADCFLELKSKFKKVDLIGLHGQTVFHEGKKSTLQIGEPSYLSMVSKKPVISNFRAGDIAAGGHGAPLAPFFHQVVFGKKNKTVSIHNLGGISNLSLIKNNKLTLAFDTGPANMLIDEEIRSSTNGKRNFDENGMFASRGKVNTELLIRMLNFKYFAELPPKSCGREQFGKDFYASFQNELSQLSVNDRLATLTELTVQSVAKSYQRFCKPYPSEIIFCGGGAKNNYMMKRLSDELASSKVVTIESLGWPSESVEGAAFALLAACRVWHIPANLTQSTGASKKVVLGQITDLRPR